MSSTIEILSYCPFCERNWLQSCDPTPEAMSIAVGKVNADRRRHIMAVHLDKQTTDADPVREVNIRMDCLKCPRTFTVAAQPNTEDLTKAAELVALLMEEHITTDHPRWAAKLLADGSTPQEPEPLEDAIVNHVFVKLACPFCDREFVQSCEINLDILIKTVGDISCMLAAHVAQNHPGEYREPELADSVRLSYACPFCKRDIGQDSGTSPDELAGTIEDLIQMAGEHFEADHKDLETPAKPSEIETLEETMGDTVTPLYLNDILDIQTAKNESAALKAELEVTAAAAEWASRCSGVKALVVKFFAQDYGIEREEFGAALTITDPGPEDHQERAYVVGFLTIPNMEEIQVTLWGTWDKTIPEVPSLVISKARLKDIWLVGNHHGDLLGPALVEAASQYQARLEWERNETLESISWNSRQVARELAENSKVNAVAETLSKHPILIPVLEMMIQHIREVDKLQETLDATEESADRREGKLENSIKDLQDEIIDKTRSLQNLEHDIELAVSRRPR